MENDRIKTTEFYRGVGLHDDQSSDRLNVVKRDIDDVYLLSNPDDLIVWAGDVSHSPESRLFAAGKVHAAWDLAAEAREVRPSIDLARLDASVAGLSSRRWRDRRCYGSMLDTRPAPGTPPERCPVPREQPLDDDAL